MHVGGSQQAKTRMMVLGVVPRKRERDIAVDEPFGERDTLAMSVHPAHDVSTEGVGPEA
jgi:hypothetical protein